MAKRRVRSAPGTGRRRVLLPGPAHPDLDLQRCPGQVRDRYQPFTITYARRTLAGWLSAVLGAGLAIAAIAEPCADEQTAAAHPQVADTRIARHCLIVRARKR